MTIKIGQPIPTTLRESLAAVLEKKDLSAISIKEGMASESTMRDLLIGSKVSDKSEKTVLEMIKQSITKCDLVIGQFTDKKNTIIQLGRLEFIN